MSTWIKRIKLLLLIKINLCTSTFIKKKKNPLIFLLQNIEVQKLTLTNLIHSFSFFFFSFSAISAYEEVYPNKVLLIKYYTTLTTRRSSLEASKGSTTHFLSRIPNETRNPQMRPHFDESNGCLQQSANSYATPHAIHSFEKRRQ